MSIFSILTAFSIFEYNLFISSVDCVKSLTSLRSLGLSTGCGQGSFGFI